MTEQEEQRVRFFALNHNIDCYIYGDDGELQCNNWQLHGRCIDFVRDSITDIMDTLQATNMKKYIEKLEKVPEDDTAIIIFDEPVSLRVYDNKGKKG